MGAYSDMTSKHIVGGLLLWLKLYYSICLHVFLYKQLHFWAEPRVSKPLMQF